MNDTALVIGGGIAGLTAALDLSSRGFRVTVIEQDRKLGGRLATAPPSLLLGCHTATWSLLEQLDMAAALHRGQHAPIDFIASGSRAQYTAFPLPSPLNTLVGTSLFQGLSMRDRWHLLTFLGVRGREILQFRRTSNCEQQAPGWQVSISRKRRELTYGTCSAGCSSAMTSTTYPRPCSCALFDAVFLLGRG